MLKGIYLERNLFLIRREVYDPSNRLIYSLYQMTP